MQLRRVSELNELSRQGVMLRLGIIALDIVLIRSERNKALLPCCNVRNSTADKCLPQIDMLSHRSAASADKCETCLLQVKTAFYTPRVFS